MYMLYMYDPTESVKSWIPMAYVYGIHVSSFAASVNSMWRGYTKQVSSVSALEKRWAL